MCATAIAYYKVYRTVSATPEARLACIGLPAPRFNSSFINAQFQPAYPGALETKVSTRLSLCHLAMLVCILSWVYVCFHALVQSQPELIAAQCNLRSQSHSVLASKARVSRMP